MKSTILLLALATPLLAKDWPMWGGTPDRNMVGTATNLPVDIVPGDLDENEQPDLSTAKNILWAVKLGSQSYGNPVVSGGKVFVGTNNESPRDPKQNGDRGVLMCFDEKTGGFLWQLVIPKLGAGKVSDWEYVGLCSSPCVVGDKAWLVTNRGEVLCLDTNGLANGNDGPFKDEAKYSSADGTPIELGDQSADILWKYDMREELGIFPHNVSSCSPLVVDGILYTATSNGVDWSHSNIPAPLAPSLVALDAEKGTLVGEEISGVSERVLHASWSSPAYGKVGGKGMIAWGGGDGFAFGFDPKPVRNQDEDIDVLKEIWRFDCNPPTYRMKDGEPIKYATYRGPSEVIATTILHDNRVYAVIGQDPEHGDGLGRLNCIDATKTGDQSGKPLWTFDDIGRSISTPSVADGLVFQAEYDGDLHCLDAATGKQLWVHETQSRIWGSTLVADGKVFLPTEDGELHILAANRETAAAYAGAMKDFEAKLEIDISKGIEKPENQDERLEKEHARLLSLHITSFGAPIYSSPIVANNVLYVATMTHLYAIKSK